MSETSPRSDKESLESSLVSSIAKRDLTDLTVDLAEVGLDAFLDEGIVRDVPVLATLVGLYRTVGIVRDRILSKKIIRFLVEFGSVPVADREQFVARCAEPNERRRLGETLILLLDRLDDMQKPEALGKLFAAYVRGRYDAEMFLNLSLALDRTPLSSLKELKAFYESQGPRSIHGGEHLSQFAFAGLLNIEFVRTGPTGGPGGS